ncbi:MAG TPA: hypothetical protein PKM43_10450 [Verrucomicrobiota bacterium]|nr:hypothetical protein [Verrucomicrobiota bacterium]HRZ37597.1 hypothetical protein [Candidatus Paceibacterota bacterium]
MQERQGPAHLEVVGGNRAFAVWGHAACAGNLHPLWPGALTGRQNTDNNPMHWSGSRGGDGGDDPMVAV